MGRPSRVAAVGATFAAAVLTITGLAGGGGAFTDLGAVPAQAATIDSSGVENLGLPDPETGKPVGSTIAPADYIWNEGGNLLFATELQAFQYDWNRTGPGVMGGGVLLTGNWTVAYILPGDSMTWTGREIWSDQVGQSLTDPPPGGVYPPSGGYKFNTYAPEANLGYWGIDMGPKDPVTGLTVHGSDFAMTDFANTTVVYNVQANGEPIPDELYDTICPQDDSHGFTDTGAEYGDWCWGPIAYSVTLKDLAAYSPAPFDPAHWGYDHMQYVYAGKSWVFGMTAKLLSEDTGGGPGVLGPQPLQNIANTSHAGEGSNYISVVGPSLQVVKQVCTKYVDGEPVCTNDDPDGWVTDETAGDDNGTAGVTAGVPTGVEQGSLPAGVTKLLWRVTAIDSGNVPMVGVHVAADEVTLQPATGSTAATVTDNDCLGMKFTDTYDASGQPSYQMLHDWQQAYLPVYSVTQNTANGWSRDPTHATELVSQPPSGALAPGGGSMTQMCTTTLSAPFTGTVQNSIGLNGQFDDPADPIFPAPDQFTYNTGDGEDGSWVTTSLGSHTYQAVSDITKTLQNRFTGFGGEVGQVASNVDSAQVVIPAEETTPPPSMSSSPASLQHWFPFCRLHILDSYISYFL